ncbi:MAG: protein kinase [Alphaproteobacteria bacterium]|nr:protein kinase [Alphaproteobacteria bacterium]MCB9698865.1 protein kinase [Alphaproteobacteria bacterium]
MGVVWRGLHVDLDLPVAVKVDLSGRAGTELFLHEVRLMSQLEHPNVVRVVDHGLIDARTAGEDLPSGARFLVMELCDGGSLSGRGAQTWPELRDATLGTLAGLAHAHGRGIVHRDIKPGNLLFHGDRVVVSDFGVSARGVERDGLLANHLVGTPRFMAPEQIDGDIRAQGPWTDIYALCVMLWQYVTGGHPYGPSRTTDEMILKHVTAQPVPFVPTTAVPAGLEDVLRQGLEKVGPRRFAFAADMAARIEELGGDDLVGPAMALDEPDAPTLAGTPSGAPSRSRRSTRSLPEGEPLDPPTRGGSTVRQLGLRDRRYEAAAVSLWGLREVPLVDRATERSALADTFREVSSTGQSRVLVLSGSGGTGKSRLSQWLSRRLHERGEAWVFEAWHSPEPDPGHGLWAMLARELGVDGVDLEEVEERILERLGDADLAADLAGAVPQATHPLPSRARWYLLERLLRHYAADRPVLLVVEDAAWAAEALEFVRELTRRQLGHPAPILVLINVRDTSLVDRPQEQALLEQLARHGARTLEIGDLDPEHASLLIREHLGLSGELAVDVEARTGGNPLFATQLVGHWLDRGLLRAGRRGLELATDRIEVPSQLTDVWGSRLDALLDGRPADDAIALEIAAWIGMDVDLAVWRGACHRAGLHPSPDLVDALLVRRFVRGGALPLERIRFVHGLLREALRSRSEQAGRGSRLNSAIADVLRGGDPDRLGGHLLAAGRLREAVPVLWAAADRQLESHDVRERTRLDLLNRTMDAVGLPDAAAERGRLELLEGQLLLLQGRYDLADRLSARLEKAARRHGWEDVLPRSLRMGGRANMVLGEREHALDLLDEAERLFEQRGERDSSADCWGAIGDVLTQLGRLDDAEQAYVFAERAADARVRVAARLGLARLAKRRGDVEQALAWLLPEDDLKQGILRGQLAPMENERGEILRAQGRNEEAERTYERAAGLYRAFGNPRAAYPLLNLGLLQVQRGEWQGARDAMEGLMRDLAGTEQPQLTCFARGVLLPALAGLGDVDSFAAQARALLDYLTQTPLREPDLARLLDQAAELATRVPGAEAWVVPLRKAVTTLR